MPYGQPYDKGLQWPPIIKKTKNKEQTKKSPQENNGGSGNAR